MGTTGRSASFLAGALVVLCAGPPSPAAAIPGVGPHETVDITTSTTKPGTPSALGYAATYRDPADANADPPALRRLVISLPPGTHIDTTVPAQCTASDQELRLMGDRACPPGSRLGSGQATADVTGLGRQTFDTTLFNAPDQQIEVIESGNAIGSNGVVRTYVRGNTLDGPVPTCIAGGNPPDGCPFDQVVLLSNHLTAGPVTRGDGASRRSYGSTPPTCPASGAWESPTTFYYADGTVETVVPRQPCEPEVGATSNTHMRCRRRRHHRHRRMSRAHHRGER